MCEFCGSGPTCIVCGRRPRTPAYRCCEFLVDAAAFLLLAFATFVAASCRMVSP